MLVCILNLEILHDSFYQCSLPIYLESRCYAIPIPLARPDYCVCARAHFLVLLTFQAHCKNSRNEEVEKPFRNMLYKFNKMNELVNGSGRNGF